MGGSILPIVMIILCMIGLVFVMYFMKAQNKPRSVIVSNGTVPVQDFNNVKDIRDIFLYTMDGYVISYVKVNSISMDLLSVMEKKTLTRKLTDEFSEISDTFTFLAVSRPVDITPLVNEYMDMMQNTDDSIRKELLRNEIKVIAEFSLSGEVVQREFFYKIWEKSSDSAEGNLSKRTNDLMNKLDTAGLSCEIIKRPDIIRLSNLVHNPAFATIEDTDVDVSIPYLDNYTKEAI